MLWRALARPNSDISFLMARIVAGPFPGDPLGMVPDPLGDVGLRTHDALFERAIPGELKIFFLAIGRIGDGADGQDDFDHSEGLYPKTELAKNGTLKCYAKLTRASRISARFRFLLRRMVATQTATPKGM
jgi:hypothetical protein